MELSSYLLFTFSALGALNAILLALWLFCRSDGNFARKFLAGMLIALGFRIFKSVLFYFDPDLSRVWLQVGLSACYLIGPFLYSYIMSVQHQSPEQWRGWRMHLSIHLALVLIVGIVWPYQTYPDLWGGLIYKVVNIVWLIYLVLASQRMYGVVRAYLGNRTWTSADEQIALATLLGNWLIWTAFFTASYTSYIMGALSFSLVLVLTLLCFLVSRQPKQTLGQGTAASALSADEAADIEARLQALEKDTDFFLMPTISLTVVAKKLGLPSATVSRFLNKHRQTSFNDFINAHRIGRACDMLHRQPAQNIETIAEACGYNSLSTFYTAFKKHKGMTPAAFRETGPS
ncbi:hypothetical protein GCM10017044_01020 [Kordiimonas sediminis]|uniref:HTH araC/xylS-type domain-containing protein n=1 Tax=Kordiimonas sediminis TaxID=1735581 RepID=A0A919E4E2_9PROT|nr:helix-turn-helix domain-containing protein [Kordiimonas sediminis]GHF11115.1 hypothetical protein GCM10017044_01020 [Kordiimonas sediminis]